MKKLLMTATMFAALTAGALAQDVPQIAPQVLLPQPPSTIQAPMQNVSSPLDIFNVLWSSQIFVRIGDQPWGSVADTNRNDLTVPLDFGVGEDGTTTEMRGFGQVYSPRAFYTYFNGSVYNESSGRINPELFETDQQYIDQFKTVNAYTVDTVIISLFKNPNSPTPEFTSSLDFFKTNFAFTSSSYRRNGFSANRTALNRVAHFDMTPEALDSTVDSENQTVNQTVIGFETPLQFKGNESMLAMYINDNAPAIDQSIPTDENDTREWQRVIGSYEWTEGGYVEDPENPGKYLDERTAPLDSNKTFGLVLFHQTKGAAVSDVVISSWAGLVFGSGPTQRRGLVDIAMTVFGTVNTDAGITYEVGYALKDQGVEVTSNPVTANSRVRFSLHENANVVIDLFDMNGQFVKSIATGFYEKGRNYLADLNAGDLQNGSYMIRMLANGKLYSSKVVIAN